MPTEGGDLVKRYLQKGMMDPQLKTGIITLTDNYQGGSYVPGPDFSALYGFLVSYGLMLTYR